MTTAPRLRVLFVIDYGSESGGAERFALGLASHLPRERFEPSFCFTREVADGPVRELRAHGIAYRCLGRRAKWDVHRLSGLARLLREHRFDIMHTHKFGSNVWGTLIGRAARVPVLGAHEHTWSYQGGALRARLDGMVVGRLATRFVAVSPADAERMVAYERVPANKVVVLPTAYVPRPGRSGADIRAELGLPAATPVIATAAVLRPQKAIEVLLEAHAQLLRRIPEAHVVIAGDGIERPHLERRANEFQLNGRVHFLGTRNDVDAIIGSADIGAMSSDFEGMPVFAFECMANHTPLVATAVGGLPSVVDSGSTGILVAPRDPAALADALSSLLLDPGRRTAMAAAASGRLAPFLIDAVARRFADLYEDLIAGARS